MDYGGWLSMPKLYSGVRTLANGCLQVRCRENRLCLVKLQMMDCLLVFFFWLKDKMYIKRKAEIDGQLDYKSLNKPAIHPQLRAKTKKKKRQRTMSFS